MLPKLREIPNLVTSTLTVRRDVIPYMDNTLHYHREYEIVFVEKSYGVRLVGNHIGNFTDGDLVFLSPNLAHVWKNDKIFYENRSNYWVNVYIIYFGEKTEHFLNFPEFTEIKKLFTLGKQGIFFKGKKEISEISNLIKKVCNSSGMNQLIYFLQTLVALTEARDYTLLSGSGYSSGVNGHDTERIDKVISFMMKNYAREIELDEVSKLIFLNKSSFCRYFKLRTKKTFSQFLNEIRIAHACELLVNKKMKISEIGYETGYNNISHFNRQFKLITGLTAKEYINKYKFNLNTFEGN